jgi:hypothetical protein
MKYLLLAAAFVVAVSVVSRPSKPQIRAGAKVVIDDWWNYDYARIACQVPRSSSCLGDDEPKFHVTSFENELKTFLATDATCHDVVFVKQFTQAAATYDFQLMLDVQPSPASVGWSLVKTSSSHYPGADYTEGHGSPQQIAHAVCAVATGKGATFQPE